MAEIFVSERGSDRGTGDYRQPLRTIARVNSLLRRGDRVRLERGSRWQSQPPLTLPEAASADSYGDGSLPVLERSPVGISLDGAGSSARDIAVIGSIGPGVGINADECTVERLHVLGCGTDGSDKSRGIRGYNVRRPKVVECVVHDTKGGDNVWFYNSPEVYLVGCDLARPGPASGDNCQISGATDFYVARNRFADVESGKGHFLAMPYKFHSTGGICEHNDFIGPANFGIGLIQSRAVVRFNRLIGSGRHKTADWSSAFWCANSDNYDPIDQVQIYGNFVSDYRCAFGSWMPKAEFPAKMFLRNETYVNCETWFSWNGSARLSGVFEDGLIANCGRARLKGPMSMQFNEMYMQNTPS